MGKVPEGISGNSGFDNGHDCTIGIVDNDKFALAALCGCLRNTGDSFRILWATDAPDTCIALCRGKETRPDCLLVDMSMSAMSGAELMKTVRKRDDRMILIGMTSFPLHEYDQQARDAGAQALVVKADAQQNLAVLDALVGDLREMDMKNATIPSGDEGYRIFSSPSEAFREISSRKPQGFDALTPLENRIIELCCEGLTSQEIAARLDPPVSATTVDTHLSRAAKKLHARNRIQLVSQWCKHGMEA